MASAECYPEKAPKVNELMDTLCHHLRRELIFYFEHCIESDSASLDEAIAHVNARVSGTTAEELRISLVHSHIPKLQERGWIDYDPRTGDMQYHGHTSADEWLNEVRRMFEA